MELMADLSEDEQDELLRLLEEEDMDVLLLLHKIPRPPRPGRPPEMREDGNFVLVLHTSNETDWREALVRRGRGPRPKPCPWADSIKRDFGHDPLLDCKGERMKWVRRIKPKRSC
jgi:hypothetical protein